MSTCPIDGPFDRWTAQFFPLKSVRIPCEKIAPAPQIPRRQASPIFQTSPRGTRTRFDKLAVWIPILIAPREIWMLTFKATQMIKPAIRFSAQAQRWFEERPSRPVLWKEFKQGSDEIENIIRTIDDIAFQTNILVLNTAVEATINRITLCFCPAGIVSLPACHASWLSFTSSCRESAYGFRQNFSILIAPAYAEGSVQHVDEGMSRGSPPYPISTPTIWLRLCCVIRMGVPVWDPKSSSDNVSVARSSPLYGPGPHITGILRWSLCGHQRMDQPSCCRESVSSRASTSPSRWMFLNKAFLFL